MSRKRLLLLVPLAACVLEVIAACTGDDPVLSGSASDAGGVTDGPAASDGEPRDAADAAAEARARTHCDDVTASRCEDFDRGPDLPGMPSISNGLGALSVDTQVFTSPGASMSTALLPSVVDAGFSAAYDRFDVAVAGSRHIAVELEWRIDTLGGGPNAGLLDLFILRADGSGGEAIHLQSAPDASASLLSFGTGFHPLKLPPLGTWIHVRIELAWPDDGGSATATVQLGNDAPVTELTALPVPSSTFNLLIGGVRVNGETPKVFHHVDDVVMRTL